MNDKFSIFERITTMDIYMKNSPPYEEAKKEIIEAWENMFGAFEALLLESKGRSEQLDNLTSELKAEVEQLRMFKDGSCHRPDGVRDIYYIHKSRSTWVNEVERESPSKYTKWHESMWPYVYWFYAPMFPETE